MRLYRGLHTDLEAVYSVSVSDVLGMPRPPNLGGSESRLRSKSLGGALPVRHGINLVRITSSRGVKESCNVWNCSGQVRPFVH